VAGGKALTVGFIEKQGKAVYIDWITWGIWLLGLIILVVWIWIPLKEFKRLLAARKLAEHTDVSTHS
jgi:hypothetical protein